MNPIDSVTTWLRDRPIVGRWFARMAWPGDPARFANAGLTLRRLQSRIAAAPASMDRAAALATAARGLQTVASLGGRGAPEMWRQGEMLWALADVHFDHAGLTGLRADMLAPFTDSTRQALREMAAAGPGAQVEALSAILDTLGPEDPARSAVAVLQTALAAAAGHGGA